METRLSLAPGQNGTKVNWKTLRELGLQERVVEPAAGQDRYRRRYTHADAYTYWREVVYANIRV
jgi:hypothetical protein